MHSTRLVIVRQKIDHQPSTNSLPKMKTSCISGSCSPIMKRVNFFQRALKCILKESYCNIIIIWLWPIKFVTLKCQYIALLLWIGILILLQKLDVHWVSMCIMTQVPLPPSCACVGRKCRIVVCNGNVLKGTTERATS